MKKSICFILMLLMLIPLVVACSDGGENSNNSSGGHEKPVYIEGYDFVVTIGNTDFTVKQINSSPEGDNIVVYTHDYMIDNKPSLVVGEAQAERTALSVRYAIIDGKAECDVVELTDDVANAQIPYNGFVITLPKTKLEGVRVNKGTVLDVKGYESAVGDYERLDLAKFNPGYLAGTASRRINFVDTENEIKDNKIYYISDSFSGNVKVSVDNLLVTLKKETGKNYEVVSSEKVSEVSVADDGGAKLLFTGAYNIAYAKYYLAKSEKVSFTMLEAANKYTDIPAVVSDDKIISFEDKFINATEITDDGAYMFDVSYDSAATPDTDKKRVDVIVVDDVVVKIAKENERSMVPGGNGFVLSFVGDKAIENVKLFEVGKTTKTYYINYSELPDKFVQVGDKFLGIDAIDVERNVEGMSVLYTDNYGKSTGTNMYGVELVIENGKITAVVSSGDAQIPANGYVLSIHKDNKKYFDAGKIKVGEEAEISLVGADYSVTYLKYTGLNTVRGEGSLIVYNGKNGKKTTETNEFGYEVAVDKDGIVVEASYSGNLSIPSGGFVLSGHGVNKDALVSAYALGEKILLNSKTKTVTIIKTPDTKILSAEHNFAEVSDKLDAAKKAFYNLDYKYLNDQVTLINNMISEAETAFAAYDYETALATASSVISTCEQLEYAMIESKGVENRAVWYRSTEKCDEEVRATVEKMKMLNVNALYLETWYEGYCIGKEVQVDGITTHPNNGDYDVLEGFVRIAHEYGIEVHAWVQNFFVGFFYEGGNQYYNPTFGPENYGDKYLIDCNGKKHFYYSANNNYFVFLNSNDRECRDMVLDIYQQLITKYEIDGLHLDYIRYPELNYGKDDFGYNQDIIDAFAKKTGITGDPRKFVDGSAEKKAWIQFRCDIITSFVGEVYDMVRDNNPDIWLSAATYPDITLSKNTIAQDIAAFVDKGYLDEIFSMSYGIDNATVMWSVKNYLKVTDSKSFYSVGIAAFLETTPKNFAYQLTDVELAGADGVSIFALASITPGHYQSEITNGAFKDPAVQVYKLSVSASAQMDYICKKSDNISVICNTLTADNFAFIKSKCAEIKEFSDAFDLKNASIAEKIKYCKDALAMIASAKSAIVAECGDNDETKAIICEFEDLEYWLNLSMNRLNTRK